jgi:chorismate dehydratase
MRLGCLPYLNVKPLVYPFEHGELPRGWELVYAPPAELAGMLRRGEIAAAPVSSFATFIDPELEIVPGICIAADGPVKSVLLLSKKPRADLDIVVLDSGSLSGANMLRIILEEAYGLTPTYVTARPEPVSRMLDEADAAMGIGNPAMLHPKEGLIVLDIAEEWKKLTGLPAVFAVWAGKGITPELVSALQDAKLRGMKMVREIAIEESEKLGLPFDLCHEYLSKTIGYDLGEREILSLKVFRDRAKAHGLLDQEAARA